MNENEQIMIHQTAVQWQDRWIWNNKNITALNFKADGADRTYNQEIVKRVKLNIVSMQFEDSAGDNFYQKMFTEETLKFILHELVDRTKLELNIPEYEIKLSLEPPEDIKIKGEYTLEGEDYQHVDYFSKGLIRERVHYFKQGGIRSSSDEFDALGWHKDGYNIYKKDGTIWSPKMFHEAGLENNPEAIKINNQSKHNMLSEIEELKKQLEASQEQVMAMA